jgi:hydrogenase expression/formation protein HypC
MCIGLPMRVLSARDGRARVAGRGEEREVETLLVGTVEPGDWLLVFIDSAREKLSPQRAAEVDATLNLLAEALGGSALGEIGFELPSAMSVAQLSALAGQSVPQQHPSELSENPA